MFENNLRNPPFAVVKAALKSIFLSMVVGLFASNPEILAAPLAGNEPLPSPKHPLKAVPITEATSSLQVSLDQRLGMAQSARKAGDRILAISLYKEIVTLDPNHLVTRVELAEALADEDQLDEARGHLDFVQKVNPTWVPVYLTRGALEQQAQNELSALKAFNQALVIEPANRFAIEGRLLALSRLGSPGRALVEAKAYSELDPEIIQRLHEDEAALAIRRSENVYHEHPSSALSAADAALVLIEANLKRYPASERSRFDYVRALTNRRRYYQAISVYEVLMAENRELPGYIHYSAAVSYLAELRPERAKETFMIALAADPNEFNTYTGLFYALCDLAEFTAAKTYIDILAARNLEPEQKFETDRLAAWVNAYEDRLGIAQDQFIALQVRAPASTALRNALGRVYLWRGWPQRAEEEFNLVAQQSPEDIEALSGLVDVDMMQGDYGSAARRITHLSTLIADDHDTVKRLKRVLMRRNDPEITISASSRRNKERTSSGESLRLDTRLYSSPVTPQNRIFAHQYYESTHFGAEPAYYKRVGLGWESIIARLVKLEIEIQNELFKDNQSSVVLDSEFQINDYWRVKGHYDSNSIEVPLRARISDIEGDSAYVGVSYRLNERAVMDFGAQRLVMSDSNKRRSHSASTEYQFIQGPFYKASVALDMSASTNTFINAAYFNPARDKTLQMTLKNEWLGFRRYDRSFHQRLYLSAGEYAQQDHSTQTIGSLRYEHEWNFSDAMNARYALAYVHTAYDGEPSKGPEVTMSMSRKF